MTGPLTVDQTFTYTPEFAREAVAYLVRGTRKLIFKGDEKVPNLPKPIHLPKDHAFMNRLQWGLASILAGLRAEGNWHRMVAPWIRAPKQPIPT